MLVLKSIISLGQFNVKSDNRNELKTLHSLIFMRPVYWKYIKLNI